MNTWQIILIPLLSAFTGWITIRLFIKLFFHPRKPRRILGITFHGILPKKQKQLAQQLGKVVSKEFLSFDIEQKINNPDILRKILPVIENHVDEFLRVRLSAEIPMVSMFVGDKTIGKLKSALMKEIESLFPKVMEQYAANLRTEFDPEQLVVQKVAAFSTEKLEAILFRNMSREFRFAGLFGAFIGFIIGIIQLLVIWMTN